MDRRGRPIRHAEFFHQWSISPSISASPLDVAVAVVVGPQRVIDVIGVLRFATQQGDGLVETMDLQAISAEAARERLAAALPGLPSRDARAQMPEAPAEIGPEARLDVWLELELASDAPLDAAGWSAATAELASVAPLDMNPDIATTRSLRARIPLVSLDAEFVLAGGRAQQVFGAIDRTAASHALHIVESDGRAHAEQRARALVVLIQNRNPELTYRVVPRRGLFRATSLAARDVFDVLLSLGFQWGDGDLFHWPASGVAGAVTISTASAPGYFVPEQAARGANVSDLLVHLYAPLSSAPLRAHDAMTRAVEYAAAVLGGTPAGSGDDPYDPQGDRHVLEGMMRVLDDAGLPPGSAAARAVF